MNHVTMVIAAAGALLVAGCSTGSPTAQSTPSTTSSGTAPAVTAAASPTSKHPPSSAPATEFNPPGDIPDNQVFTPYRVPGSKVQIQVPEGWARTASGGTVTFTDKYNSVSIAVVPRAAAPTPTTATTEDVPPLKSSVTGFHLGTITTVQRKHGTAVLITYAADSAVNPVTGKVVRDAVERYEFWSAGQLAVLTLAGPKGADNVDPWRIVSDSLTWR